MVSLEEMASHYNERTDEMPGLWSAGVKGKKDEFSDGIEAIIGVPVKDSVVNRWASRVADAKDEYASAIKDKGDLLTKMYKKNLAA